MPKANTAVFVRSPIIRPQHFFQLFERLDPELDAEQREVAIARRLIETFISPQGAAALYVASPSLHARVAEYLASPSRRALEEIVPRLARYWSRMCFRATPFGLFAGVGLAELETSPGAAKPDIIAAVRLDATVAQAIVSRLGSDPLIRERLRYRGNDSCRFDTDSISYIEPVYSADNAVYRRSQVDRSPHLDQLLARARQWTSYDELVAVLTEFDPELVRDEASTFVAKLIDSAVLVSELAGDANCVSFSRALRDALRGRAPAPIEAALDRLDAPFAAEPAATAPELIRASDAVKSVMQEMGVAAGKSLLQVDCRIEGAAPALTAASAERIGKQFGELASHLGDRFASLAWFRDAFREKFGSAEVPLLIALDERTGIALQSTRHDCPILAGLALRGGQSDSLMLPKWEAWLLRLTLEALQSGAQERELTSQDLRRYREEPLAADPPDLYCLSVIPGAATDMAGNDAPVILDTFSPGLNLVARFGYLAPGMEQVTRDLATREASHSDAVLAEVNFLPAGRAGNVSTRPPLYDFEIPLSGREHREESQCLRLDDLYLRVDGDEIVLRSKRLNRRVLPRLPNAHNFFASEMPIYNFLGQLQHEGKRYFKMRWGQVERLAPFMPQLRYKNLVISRRRWLLDVAALGFAKARSADAKDAILLTLIGKLALPQFVSIARGDQQLVLDLESKLYRSLLCEQLSTTTQLIVEDAGVIANGRWIAPTKADLSTEVVIPFASTTTRDPNDAVHAAQPAAAPPEFCLPGDQWLYLKLYAKPQQIDHLIANQLQPLETLLAAGSPYFYLRYKDPDWHLRIRIRISDRSKLLDMQDLLLAWQKDLHSAGAIQRVQVDTYEREVERYGGAEALLLCEQYFCADSRFAAQAVAATPTAPGQRWLCALASVDALLDDFGFDPARKLEIISSLRRGYGKEFSETATMRKQLGLNYRKESARIQLALGQRICRIDGEHFDLSHLLDCRKTAAASAVTSLHELQRQGRLLRGLDRVVESLIHMATNRLFMTQMREQELVVYDFLRRHYLSESARIRLHRNS